MKDLNILFLKKDVKFANFIESTLVEKKIRYKITEVKNYDDLKNYLPNNTVDLFIFDNDVVDTNRFDLILSNDESYSPLSTIAISSRSVDEIDIMLDSPFVHDHMCKKNPSQESLLNAVEHVFAQRQAVEKISKIHNELIEEKMFLKAVLDNINQGVSVFNSDLKLSAYNQQYKKILGLPDGLLLIGTPLREILNYNANRGDYGDGDIKEIVARKLAYIKDPNNVESHHYERRQQDGKVIKIDGNSMPGGGWVTTYTDITEQKKAEETIRKLALKDTLTGLANRNLFNRKIEEAIDVAQRTGNNVGVLLLDLDGFKSVNDTYGHQAGDKLLTSVARRLEKCVRTVDTVARLGGDEFAVIIADLDDKESVTVPAERMINAIEEPFAIDELILRLSTSIGIGFFPDDDSHKDELLRKTDLALYDAKESGKGVYKFYDTILDKQASTNKTIELELYNALNRNQFVLYFQPQFNIRDRSLTGVEALIRWQHPENGLYTPAQFLDVAENKGLMIPIGYWVLEEACRIAKKWQSADLPLFRVTINLSTGQIRDKSFLYNFKKILQKTSVDPRFIEFEIKEDTVMSQSNDIEDTLIELDKLGVSFAVDDFGTGYSSLSRSKQYPFLRLKIDNTFIMNLLGDNDNSGIAKAIIDLGHSLNLQVLAEGVETEEDLKCLQKLGCDEVQGYYFCKPISSQDFSEWLLEYTEQKNDSSH